jgi:hypothetical protein
LSSEGKTKQNFSSRKADRNYEGNEEKTEQEAQLKELNFLFFFGEDLDLERGRTLEQT